MRDYLVAILLDYVVIDPDLGELPLLRAHQVAESLCLEEALVSAIRTKLKRTKKSVLASLANRDSDLLAAEVQATVQGSNEGVSE